MNKCISCKEKKFVESLKNPHIDFKAYGDGLPTIKTSLNQIITLNLQTFKNYFWAIIFDSIHLNANTLDSNIFYIASTTYDPTLAYGSAATFNLSNFPQYPTAYIFKTNSSYRVVSGLVNVQVFKKSATGTFSPTSHILHGACFRTNILNTANNIYLSNFITADPYYKTDKDELNFIFTPTNFPIPFKPLNYNPQTDINYTKTIFSLIYQDATASTVSDNIYIQIRITQNVEIFNSQDPLVATRNIVYNHRIVSELIKDLIINNGLIIQEKLQPIKKFKSCQECKYNVVINMFNSRQTFFKLPDTKNNFQTILICKSNTFTFTTNVLGNGAFIFNPYVLYTTNNTTNAYSNIIKLEYSVINSTFNWDGSTTTSNLTQTTNLTGNTFLSNQYIKQGRLLKGYVNIKDNNTLLSTSGKIFMGIIPYSITFTGTNPYYYTTLLDDTSVGPFSLDNMTSKLHFVEQNLPDGLHYIITPEYWNYYKYYDFEPQYLNYTNGFNTAACVIGIYSAKPNQSVNIEIDLFYEAVYNEYQQSNTNKIANIGLTYKHIKPLSDGLIELGLNTIKQSKFSDIGTKYKAYKINKRRSKDISLIYDFNNV